MRIDLICVNVSIRGSGGVDGYPLWAAGARGPRCVGCQMCVCVIFVVFFRLDVVRAELAFL